MLNKVLDKHAPVVEKRVKKDRQPDWYNSEIIYARNMRDKYNALGLWSEYRFWRNKTKQIIENSKKNYYKNMVKDSNDSKSLWKCLHSLNPKFKKSPHELATDENNTTTNDKKSIADTFNNFFTSCAEELREQRDITSIVKADFNNLSKFIKNQLKQQKHEKFTIPPIKINELFDELIKLDVNKSSGTDNIGPQILKISAPCIASPLTYIFNRMIDTGIYPSLLKNAKVTPVYKDGDNVLATNYRPISVLPSLSKTYKEHLFIKNPSVCLQLFYDMLNKVLDKHAPVVEKRVKKDRQPDWYNSEIIYARNMRDKYNALGLWSEYRFWRNKTKQIIENSKKNYYKNMVKDSNDSKSLWKCLHSLNPKFKKSPHELATDENNTTTNDKKSIADTFNTFFTSCAEELREQRDITSIDKADFNNLSKFIKNQLKQQKHEKFTIPPIKINELFDELIKLDVNKSSGTDNIGTQILKISAPCIASPLTYIFNRMIDTGVYPSLLKNAKVTPVYKDGDKQGVKYCTFIHGKPNLFNVTGGKQSQYRSCNKPATANGGTDCVLGGVNSVSCNDHPCPVNGKFSDWGQWSSCIVNSGCQGYRERERSCNTPAPQHGEYTALVQ
ncbi:unnamed protein product [Mytilus edulis]|uniref:Uncharacterized protein n=1 Tax=Mytilus edulis TaxID=6550 RepID=A0A8S3SHA4_MYTED|nr:unnamed protein product [Mytilus edulis]